MSNKTSAIFAFQFGRDNLLCLSFQKKFFINRLERIILPNFVTANTLLTNLPSKCWVTAKKLNVNTFGNFWQSVRSFETHIKTLSRKSFVHQIHTSITIRYSPPFVDCNYMIASDDVADSDQNPLKCLF